MNVADEEMLRQIIRENGAYDVLWSVVDYLEDEWPTSPVGQIVPPIMRAKMKRAAGEIKLAAHRMLI